MLQNPFKQDTLFDGYKEATWSPTAIEYANQVILDARVNIDNIERCQHQIQTAVYIVQQRWKTGFSVVLDIITEIECTTRRDDADIDCLQLKFCEYLHFLHFLFDNKLPGDYFHNILEHGAALIREPRIGTLALLDQQAEEATQPVHRRIAMRATTRLGGRPDRYVPCHYKVEQHHWATKLLHSVILTDGLLSRITENRITGTVVVKHRKKTATFSTQQQHFLRMRKERILNKVQSRVQRDDHMSIDEDAGAADDTEHEEDDEETLELVSLDEVLYNTESC